MLEVRMRTVGLFDENSFIIGCGNSGSGVLIDPGGEGTALLELAAEAGLEIEAIWLTHAHIDHVAGVAEAVELTGAPVVVHIEDRFLYEAASVQGQRFGVEIEPPPEPQRWLEGGEILTLGELRIEVLHVPGHSPGHVAYWEPESRAVFSGDCIFAGSIGRSDLPGGSHETLMASIENVIFPLGDDVRIYSGHGPATTVQTERLTNPFFGGGGAYDPF